MTARARRLEFSLADVGVFGVSRGTKTGAKTSDDQKFNSKSHHVLLRRWPVRKASITSRFDSRPFDAHQGWSML
jgi:hypothetical protein